LLQTYTVARGTSRSSAAGRNTPAGRSIGTGDSPDMAPRFHRNYEIFRSNLRSVRDFIAREADAGIYGFGASDITGNLAYFLETDFSELRNILDDTPYKQDRFIPRLKPSIVSSAQMNDWSGSTILITAPQASRPILGRLLALKPKKIVSPNVVF
jgi:hypothetical protein